jgi:hypothetical protein
MAELKRIEEEFPGYYEVRAGRREPSSNSQIVWQADLHY